MSQHGIDWSTRGLRDRFLGRWVEVRGGCCSKSSTSGSRKIERQGGQGTGGLRPGRFIRSYGLRLWLDRGEYNGQFSSYDAVISHVASQQTSLVVSSHWLFGFGL